VDPPQRYLRLDYSLDCDGGRYSSFVWFAALMVLVYPVGIPALYFTLLWNNREVYSICAGSSSLPSYSQCLKKKRRISLLSATDADQR